MKGGFKIKTELLQIRITSEFKERLKQAAEKENRTISNYVMTVLQEKLREDEKK